MDGDYVEGYGDEGERRGGGAVAWEGRGEEGE